MGWRCGLLQFGTQIYVKARFSVGFFTALPKWVKRSPRRSVKLYEKLKAAKDGVFDTTDFRGTSTL
jgi:hypothetical protein